MSQGNGALGARNSAVGSSGAQYGASPIKSFPSAPSPCSKMTRRLGLPPTADGREGPDRAAIIDQASRKPSSSWYRYRRSPPAVIRGGAGVTSDPTVTRLAPSPTGIFSLVTTVMAVVYPCFCTRREIQDEIARRGGAPPAQSGPPYPGTCPDLRGATTHREAVLWDRLRVAARPRSGARSGWPDRVGRRGRRRAASKGLRS